MLQKLFNPEWQITSKPLLLSSFLIGFSFLPTAEISRLELEFEESLPQKTASIFKEGIGQESNGAANQEKQSFLADGHFACACSAESILMSVTADMRLLCVFANRKMAEKWRWF